MGALVRATAGDDGWWRQSPPPRVELGPATFSGEGGIPFAALLVFTSILLLAPQNVFPVLAPLRIALVSAGLAIITHVAGRLMRQRPVMHLDPALALAGGLLCWAVVTVPFSAWPTGSASLVLDLYVKSLAVFWLIANAVDTPGRLGGMMWALALLSVPLTVTAARNFASGTFIPGAAIGRIVGYDAPLTHNPNDLALMLNLVLPLCVALFLTCERPAIRALLLGIIGFHVAGVVLTFSRAGFLSLGVGACFCLGRLARRGGWIPVASILLLALLALPLLPSGYQDRLATISDVNSDRTFSAQSRWRDQVAAVSFFLDHPLMGEGAGMDILALNEVRGNKWVSVHNAYLEYAVDLGLPGVSLFVALIWVCLRAVRRAKRACPQGENGRRLFVLAEGIEVSLVVFAFAALFHPVAYQFFFFYVAGLAVAARAVCEAPGGLPKAAA